MAGAPLRPARTAQFKRDYKRCRKRGYDMTELATVMKALIARRSLEQRQRDHSLGGTWAKHRECHVRSDWLLIYRVEGDVITFERTGTHADLFE